MGPIIIINGEQLPEDLAIILRLSVGNFLVDLKGPFGESMGQKQKSRLKEKAEKLSQIIRENQ